ncbi:MAG: insulinase family protein [Planctomycetes bacterium]|nr:insulinase family protein [Planctomycetota bacterium]
MDFDTSQGYVRIGWPAVTRRDPSYPALALAATVLSRRLYDRIRSSEGLAYSAAAWLAGDWELPSLFTVEFQTKAASVPYAASLALAEAKRLAEEPPGAPEMDLARKEILSSLRATFGRASDRARTFAMLLLEAPAELEFYRDYAVAVGAAPAEAVRAAAARTLVRPEMRILCVGPAGEIGEGDGEHPATLADFGAARALEAPSPAGPPKTPREVVQALVRALGRGEIAAVRTLFSEAMRKEFEAPGALDELAAQAKMLGGARSEVAGVEESEGEAVATVRFALTMGGQEMKIVLEFRLVRENGNWVCDDIRPKEK